MISYKKNWYGLHLLLRLYGSAVVRTLLWGGLAALQVVLLYVFTEPDTLFGTGRLPIAFSVYASIMGFVIVFRQNASYGRYREGRVELQAMTAAWTDAASKGLCFDAGAGVRGPPVAAQLAAAAAESGEAFRRRLLHLSSLLHALALQFLRSDWDLANIVPHNRDCLPAWDAMYCPGFRPSFKDYVLLRGTLQAKRQYFRASPLPVLGPLGRLEAQALASATDRPKSRRPLTDESRGPLQALFSPSHGQYTRGASERVYTLYTWLQELCRRRLAEGGLAVPDPVLATLFSSLDRGLAAFEHCRYLCDTPFPFPWAQLVVALLVFFQLAMPVVIRSEVSRMWFGVPLCVVSVQIFWALNEVSRELEDPYIFEPNELPLSRLQYQFNERLCSMAAAELPPEEEAAGAVAGLSLGGGDSALEDGELPGAQRNGGAHV